MKAERMTYEALLESLADGVDVDWTALDAKAVTDDERRRYRNLRLVARVAKLHRTIDLDEAGELDAAVPRDAVTDEDAESEPGAVEDGHAQPLVRWGHLEVLERIAGGAFGDVYRARDPQLDREVALKILRPGASWRRPLDRLLAEARTLARVHHPNVVTVHGADVRDGRAGLWMEFVEGRTLDAWLQAQGALGAGEATAVGLDLCRALAAVHAAGLVHADIKAHNVMREDGGRIVLMDFGAGRAQANATAAAAGTPLYLAPEVLAGAPPTPRSDVYSLGVLLFHLLTRAYPSASDGVAGLRVAHAAGERTRLRDLRPELPARLVDIVERALETAPERRFATAGEMERALAESAHSPRRKLTLVQIAAGVAAAVAAIVIIGVALPRLRAGAVPRLESVAVLPFAIPAADAAHLAGGLSNDVVRELQRFDIDVKRASTAGSRVPPDTLQARLGAAALVRGNVSGEGNARTLHVMVIRAGGDELWSHDYSFGETALPSLAETIAGDIAGGLGLRQRSGVAEPRHRPAYRAYEAYQRGRVLAEDRSERSLNRSIAYFKEAARIDPAYAEPWAGMADAYVALGVPAFGPLSPLEARRLAKESAVRALELDPDLVEAQTSLAFQAFLHDWAWKDAQARFDKALALNPQYALAHHWYAEYLNEMGRFDEALTEIRRAQALDPLSILINRDVAWHFYCQRRYDEAIAQLRETLTFDPDYAPAITLLARSLTATGHYPEALAELERAKGKISAGSYLSFRGYIEAVAGMRPEAEASLAELRADAHRGYVSPYYVALIYTALGRPADALTELERAYNEQDSTLVTVNIDPRFDSLRDEARFRALVARMQFPPGNH